MSIKLIYGVFIKSQSLSKNPLRNQKIPLRNRDDILAFENFPSRLTTPFDSEPKAEKNLLTL